MATSIAPGAKSASRRAKRGIFLDRNWRLVIERAARRQRHTPPGAPLWHFLTRPASIAYTDDGELALELGDPPLVLISSDADLLPEIRLELEVMRYGSQLYRMTDRQRQHQARIYTAGAYLADALEQLADGLLAPATTRSWDLRLSAPRAAADRCPPAGARTSVDRHLSPQIRADRFPLRARNSITHVGNEARPELALPAIGRS